MMDQVYIERAFKMKSTAFFCSLLTVSRVLQQFVFLVHLIAILSSFPSFNVYSTLILISKTCVSLLQYF